MTTDPQSSETPEKGHNRCKTSRGSDRTDKTYVVVVTDRDKNEEPGTDEKHPRGRHKLKETEREHFSMKIGITKPDTDRDESKEGNRQRLTKFKRS